MKFNALLRALIGGLLLAVIATPANAKEPTLKEQVQGKWARTNHPFSFQIKGDAFEHYSEGKPFTPTAVGKVSYPIGKDYVIVKLSNGDTWWVFSAGKNVVAVEFFLPDGTVIAEGRVYYRDGTVLP